VARIASCLRCLTSVVGGFCDASLCRACAWVLRDAPRAGPIGPAAWRCQCRRWRARSRRRRRTSRSSPTGSARSRGCRLGTRRNEYFVSGRAKLYEYGATGVRFIAPCPAERWAAGLPESPYTTRMLVKRPDRSTQVQRHGDHRAVQFRRLAMTSRTSGTARGRTSLGQGMCLSVGRRGMSRSAPSSGSSPSATRAGLGREQRSRRRDHVRHRRADRCAVQAQRASQPAPSPQGAPRFRGRVLAGRGFTFTRRRTCSTPSTVCPTAGPCTTATCRAARSVQVTSISA